MGHEVIEQVESVFRREKPLDFHVGDTVTVHQRIIEGDKERIQPFSGVVIARRGRGMQSSFTVRRIVNNEGVERTWPVNSPKVADIEIVRSGKIRRAKLYFLRDRVGKARRLRDKRTGLASAVATTESSADETQTPATGEKS